MKVLIVAKTHMVGQFCVGGLAQDTNQNVRLMRPDGTNQLVSAGYDVGQVWDIDFTPSGTVDPPHVEDVVVHQATLLGTVRDPKQKLLSRVEIWHGGPMHIFGGKLFRTDNGSYYVCRDGGIPGQSVGFWQPGEPLFGYQNEKGRTRYRLKSHQMQLSYVGTAEPIEVIPPDALLRVSLARWWRPSDNPDAEERCYLQLSGWFL